MVRGVKLKGTRYFLSYSIFLFILFRVFCLFAILVVLLVVVVVLLLLLLLLSFFDCFYLPPKVSLGDLKGAYK